MAAPQPPLDPQVIARAFVDQYYRILHRSPDQVYRFYQETSILSRLEANGTMTSATTLQGINQKIMSMDVSNYFWEIETADAQPSYLGGVFIVVGGSLTGPDRIRRPFSQSFFLAPQETNGYFVLNDILRVALDRTGAVIANGMHVLQPNGMHGHGQAATSVVVHLQSSNGGVALPSDDDNDGSVPVLVNGAVGGENCQASVTAPPESGQADLDHDLEGSHISEPLKEDHVAPTLSLSNGDANVRERAMNGFATSNGAEERESTRSGVAPNNANKEAKKKQHVEVVVPQQDAPKRSYALIVMKGSPVSKPVEVAVKNNTKVVEKIEKPVPVPAAAPTPTPATTTTTTPEATVVATDTNGSSGNNSNEEQGYSIFVKNLPVQVKPEQLEEVYKKFGAIKTGGVQVRMSRFDRYWFGFVEFESIESMQAAIEAQPVLLNGREVFCEEKRSSSRVVNGIHVRPDGNMNGGGGGNGFRGPLRTNNGYRNESYRGGGRAPMRGGRGQRPMSSPMRPRDSYHHHHHHHAQQQQQQQRNFHNGNGRPGFSLKGPVETPVAA